LIAERYKFDFSVLSLATTFRQNFKSMIEKVKNYYKNHPLNTILGVGLLLRLLSAIFSKGYGMTDDHFKIIEEAQSLLIGQLTDEWVPIEGTGGGKRSMLYPYLHYLFFKLLESIQITDPQVKMYFVRFIHAFYSMLTIVFSFKIMELLSDKKWAARIGWIAAMFWFLPMMSVRNLVEVVSMPLLLWGTYILLRYERNLASLKHVFIAGVVFSFAFTIRFQAVSFIGGIVFFLMYKKYWKALILLGLGGLLPFVFNHIFIESILFDFPLFGKLINYIEFNLENSTTYVIGPWYNYALLFLGIFIPPLSIIMLIGLFKASRKYLILSLPFFCFFLFHSFFPGKQERFVLPILMFFPILGFLGYRMLIDGNAWWSKHQKFFQTSWKIFWVINIIVLIPITLTYSKRSKVEAMYHLSPLEMNEKDYILYCADRFSAIGNMPYYYMKAERYPAYMRIYEDVHMATVLDELKTKETAEYPDFIFLFHHDKMDERLEEFKTVMPNLSFEKTMQASFIDRFMHWLNPKNRNYSIDIYRNKK